MTTTPPHVDTDELIETLERLEKEATRDICVVCKRPKGHMIHDVTGERSDHPDAHKFTPNDGPLNAALRNHLPALISALKEMREALSDATEAIIMMSGSSDFASDGQAGAWWAKFRDEKFYPAILPLTITAAKLFAGSTAMTDTPTPAPAPMTARLRELMTEATAQTGRPGLASYTTATIRLDDVATILRLLEAGEGAEKALATIRNLCANWSNAPDFNPTVTEVHEFANSALATLRAAREVKP